MADVLDKFKDEIAFQKLEKAEGTGAISKLLSLLSSHVLVLLLVFLLKAKLYIALVIFLLLGFTRFAFVLGLIGLGYFIYNQNWIGVTLISIYTVLASSSGIIGHREIKRNIFTNKTNISPFEGMKDLPIIIFLQLIFFGLALYLSGFLTTLFWIFYSLATFFLFSRVYMRLKSKWCSIYYPLSIRYAHFIGHEVGTSERQGKIPSIENATTELVKSVYPNITETNVENLIQTTKEKLNTFSDRSDLIEYYMRFYKNSNRELYEKFFDKVEAETQKNIDRSLPTFVYAEIIERDFGKTERLKYLMELFNGNFLKH